MKTKTIKKKIKIKEDGIIEVVVDSIVEGIEEAVVDLGVEVDLTIETGVDSEEEGVDLTEEVEEVGVVLTEEVGVVLIEEVEVALTGEGGVETGAGVEVEEEIGEVVEIVIRGEGIEEDSTKGVSKTEKVLREETIKIKKLYLNNR